MRQKDMLDHISIKLFLEECVIPHKDRDENFGKNYGYWVLIDSRVLSKIGDLWHIAYNQGFPDLATFNVSVSDLVLVSERCILNPESSIMILHDRQEIRITRKVPALDAIDDTNSSPKRRKVSEHVSNLALSTKSSFNSSCTILTPEGTSAWSSLRMRTSNRYVPDWVISRLPSSLLCTRQGIPKSGEHGVVWRKCGKEVGWATCFKRDKIFFSLNKYSHKECMELARDWLEEQYGVTDDEIIEHDALVCQKAFHDAGSCIEATSSEESGETESDDMHSIITCHSDCHCRALATRLESLKSDDNDYLTLINEVKNPSVVSGIYFCGGVWKVRWLDSAGRERIRTYGSTSADRQAAENYIKALNEKVLSCCDSHHTDLNDITHDTVNVKKNNILENEINSSVLKC